MFDTNHISIMSIGKQCFVHIIYTTQPLGSTSRDTLHLPYMALHSNEMFI